MLAHLCVFNGIDNVTRGRKCSLLVRPCWNGKKAPPSHPPPPPQLGHTLTLIIKVESGGPRCLSHPPPTYSNVHMDGPLRFIDYENSQGDSGKTANSFTAQTKQKSTPFFVTIYIIDSSTTHALTGTIAWDGFFAHCILSRIESKILNFLYVVLIFTELGQYLSHLACKENTQNEIFLLGRLKILIAFCFLRALI